jgi:hypothetical protein
VDDAVEEVGGDRRVRLADAVVGRGQPIVLDAADAEAIHGLEHGPAGGERQRAREAVDADLVQRLAEEVLGQDVGAAARGEHDLVGDVGGLGGDVHGRVADADDQDLLAPPVVGVDEVVGVHLLAVEAARVGRVGPARVPVVAVGHEQRVDGLRLARVERELPAATGPARGVLDARLEADAVADAEVVDVGVEVAGDLGVVREVRIGLRHGEVRVLHALPRRVDVQVAVGGRHPVDVLEHPVAPHTVALLEAGHGDPPLVEGLERGDAGRAGSDDGGGGKGAHAGLFLSRATKMTQASP